MSKIIISTAASSLIIYAGGNIVDYDNTATTLNYIEAKNTIDRGTFIEVGIGCMQIIDKTSNEKLDAPTVNITTGYRVNPYISIEARGTHTISHLDYNKYSTEKSNSHYSHIGVDAKISYPVKKASPYIMIGYGQNRITNFKGSSRKENSPYVATGIQYQLDNSSSIAINYLRAYNSKGFDGRATEDNIRIEQLNISLSYKF